MNVLLISECTKKALTETRRILDQFAERRGERTWQTPITQQGLDTLRKLLRKTARKNTAVACHWIRGVDHSELLWIVGDASRFSAEGAVPTNTTTRNVLRRHDENDWHTGEDISLLAQMAALLHDLGKASVAFQSRLKTPVRESNLYRHEWVSLRVFAAFVGTDDDEGWLTRMAASSGRTDWLESGRYLRDGLDAAPPPFERLPPLAAAIGWLIVTHHRLPVMPVFDQDSHKQQFLGARVPHFVQAAQLDDLFRQVQHSWNERLTEADANVIEPYWAFEHGLPVVLPKWRNRAAKIALRMLALVHKPDRSDWLSNPYVMHLARLSLMLADHHYSALGFDAVERVAGDSDPRAPETLFANTGIDKDKRVRRKQTLDEHLLGVARDVGAIVHALPGFERNLPRLVRHRGLRKRTDKQRFLWQNKAADVADSVRARAVEHGAFIVNMASTGCGKTLANARMMNALADPQQGMRCTFALGLRTLTLQTGRSYRHDLHLGEDDLAILTGGSASRALFEYYEKQAEQSGSASVQDLLTEDSYVVYDGLYAENGLLDKAMKDPKIRALLSAPVLVSTIDHLMPATEAHRAGRQIAPMLRLMSADLVLDELDDFDIDDLPAVTRLVHWAGLLGSRVLISSATLPPSLVEGLYQAYRAGRAHYRRNRGPLDGRSDAKPEIACLWVDEFDARAMSCVDVDAFRSAHARFVQYRVGRLAEQPPRRRGALLPLKMVVKDEVAIRREFATQVLDAAVQAHAAHHEICPVSGKRVSFGLVRMANIEPLFDVALELFRLGAPENHHVHLCAYHSRFPLLLRSAIEHRLDTVLNRRDKNAVYALPEVRQAIDADSEENHLFVVLGSPVTEVGRDHDYDWAVVEPSSMRSLIQLAGRVLRHRQEEPATPNVFIFDTNLKHYTGGRSVDGQRRAAFVRPGFEDISLDISSPFRLISHSLQSLLREDQYTTITARPRVEPASQSAWKPKESLVDLEHARLHQMMTPKERALVARVRGQRPAARDLDAACAWQYPHAMFDVGAAAAAAFSR
ncbi:MAG: type I-F CRISPR-associated helicase Cas3f [Rhodocyclaceae bacterium]